MHAAAHRAMRAYELSWLTPSAFGIHIQPSNIYSIDLVHLCTPTGCHTVIEFNFAFCLLLLYRREFHLSFIYFTESEHWCRLILSVCAPSACICSRLQSCKSEHRSATEVRLLFCWRYQICLEISINIYKWLHFLLPPSSWVWAADGNNKYQELRR